MKFSWIIKQIFLKKCLFFVVVWLVFSLGARRHGGKNTRVQHTGLRFWKLKCFKSGLDEELCVKSPFQVAPLCFRAAVVISFVFAVNFVLGSFKK